MMLHTCKCTFQAKKHRLAAFGFVCEKFEFCVNKKIIPIKSQIVYGEVLLPMLFCDKMVNNTNCK